MKDTYQPLYDMVGIKKGKIKTQIPFFTIPLGEKGYILSPDGKIKKVTKTVVHTNYENFSNVIYYATNISFRIFSTELISSELDKFLEYSTLHIKYETTENYNIPLTCFKTKFLSTNLVFWQYEFTPKLTLINPYESFECILYTSSDLQIKNFFNIKIEFTGWKRTLNTVIKLQTRGK